MKAHYLAESSARLRFDALVASLDCIVIAVDSGLRVSLWNPAAVDATGVPTQIAIGAMLEDLPFSWATPLVAALNEARQGSRRVLGKELQTTTDDVVRRTFGASVYAIESTTGSKVGLAEEYLILARDISHQKRAAEALERSARLQSIGELAAGIAHEINTPTQYAENNLLYIELTLKDLLDAFACVSDGVDRDSVSQLKERFEAMDLASVDEQLREAISDAREGLGEISRIVDGVRQFAHPGSGNEWESVDLNKAIESAVRVCEPRWKSRATVRCELDPALPRVYCRAAGLKQAIVNLVVNAADAYAELDLTVPRRGIVVRSNLVDDDVVVVKVEDGAGGMSPEVQRQVFDPFFTTKPVGQGTGQGLSLVHSIVAEEHGGSVDVDSTVGEGTVFTVRVPLRRREQLSTAD